MKKFRIAKAGQTTDGREITVDQIQQMAKGYSPAKYGARLNIEHIRSVMPDGIFGAYGDVTALTVEVDGADTYLVAEINPTPALIALSKARQKVYFSVEIDPKFAGTGEAYLVGLACTDSPASLGTSYMQFCQQNAENPLKARKQNPDNQFSTSEFFAEFTEEKNDEPSVMEQMKAFFASLIAPPEKEEKKPDPKTPELVVGQAPDLSGAFNLIAQAQDASTKQINQLLSKVEDLTKTVNEQQALIDKIPNPNQNHRNKATGSGGEDQKTDC